DQHAAAIAERAMDAVAVACRENADDAGAFGDEFAAVADAGGSGNMAQADDAGAKAQHGLERELAFGFFAYFRWIVARMVAVKNDAGADHVGPGFWAAGDGGAVGEMHDAGVDAELAHALEGDEKVFFLLARLFAVGCRCEGFGRREMRHDAAEAQICGFRELS